MSSLITLLLAAHTALVLGWSDWHPDNCKDGRRAIVQLFEWKWTDIAEECERFLGPIGYCGVQVSPVTEHVTTAENAWWERYQPVSYKISSRSGSEEQFTDMVQRCNAVGVRTYVEVVLNHMTHVDYSSAEQPGYDASDYDASTGSYPEVPYTIDDFNACDLCSDDCGIDDWTNKDMVRTCRKAGLMDIDHVNGPTIATLTQFLNDLIEIGVAGFSIDSAIHMDPVDLADIWQTLKNLNTPEFPPNSNPFMYMHVEDLNVAGEIEVQEYNSLGRVSEYRFGMKIVDTAGNPPSIGSIWDPGFGMLDPDDAFVFVDNHEMQRGIGRISNVLSYKNGTDYIMAQALTLSFTYGFPRVMSSYDFGADTERGPPMVDGAISDVEIQPDGSCGGEWVCEHRWTAIAGLVTWAKATSGTDILTWWEEGDKLAFSRGGRGFVAFNNPDQGINTGLPAGEYCNVAQGCPTEDGCTGDIITVEDGGNGLIYGSDIVAIHVDAMARSNECIFGIPAPTIQPPTTIPTEPTTIPTEPTTIPTEPTTIPTEPTTIPTEPTTIPTEPTTIPTEPTTIPTEPTTIPTEPTTIPTEPTTIPTESTTIPTEPTTIPTEPTTIPTEPTTIPTEPTTIPTEPTTIPTEPTTIPTEPTTIPTEPTTIPTEPTTIPTEPTTIPTEPTTIPTEPTTIPTEPTTIPTEPTTIPTEPTTIPTEPTTIPTEPTTIPTEPTTTESPWKKTIIYIDTYTADGQFVFYRGGVSHQMNPACEGDTDASSECSIPISVKSIGETSHYNPYNSWSVGDTVLDWHGAEVGQGSYQDISALGTPAAWTTNDVNHRGYQPDNSWGPNHHKVEFMMNCDETLDGWFEFKAFKYIPGQDDQWENDIKQDIDKPCFGDLNAQTPFQNINHIALCGARNKFGWNFPYCDISSIDDDS